MPKQSNYISTVYKDDEKKRLPCRQSTVAFKFIIFFLN